MVVILPTSTILTIAPGTGRVLKDRVRKQSFPPCPSIHDLGSRFFFSDSGVLEIWQS